MSHAVFAATLAALAILSLFNGDFAVVLQPVPKSVPAREILVYLSACVLLASGLGLLWRRTASYAAAVLVVFLLLWLLLFRVPVIFHTPIVVAGSKDAFQLSESLVSWTLTAAAWVVADSFSGMQWLAVERRPAS